MGKGRERGRLMLRVGCDGENVERFVVDGGL